MIRRNTVFGLIFIYGVMSVCMMMLVAAIAAVFYFLITRVL